MQKLKNNEAWPKFIGSYKKKKRVTAERPKTSLLVEAEQKTESPLVLADDSCDSLKGYHSDHQSHFSENNVTLASGEKRVYYSVCSKMVRNG